MSKRVINPDQLRMFMRPGELKEATFPGDKLEGESEKSMWAIKEHHNWQNDMDEEVLARGVRTPVVVTHGPEGAKAATSPYEAAAQSKPVLSDGHHRVQAAEYAERNTGREYYVPVVHGDTDPWA